MTWSALDQVRAEEEAPLGARKLLHQGRLKRPPVLNEFEGLYRAAHRARHRRVDGRVRRTITRLRLGLGNTRFYPSHDGRNGRQTGHRQIL